MAKGTLSRNAPSGTTRMSVGEDPLQASLGLGECFLEVIELLAESEADVVREAEVVARHQEDAVLRPHLLHQLEGADPLAVPGEADRPGVRRMPGERVAEALQPRLEHRVVGLEDTAGGAARRARLRPPRPAGGRGAGARPP